jgi:hypothetical protein
MTADNLLPRITAKSAAEVCQSYPVAKELKPVVAQPVTPLQFLDWVLGQADKPKDAVDFLARALPHRESVWWGSLCVLRANHGPLPAKEEAALGAAVLWSLDPSEGNRLAAGSAAKEAADTPAGLLADAAFSGKPFDPADALPPGPTGSYVAGAILLLASHIQPAKDIVAELCRFVAIGIGVAQEKYLPPADAPPRSVPAARAPKPKAAGPAVGRHLAS